jgi:hypothetical protein
MSPPNQPVPPPSPPEKILDLYFLDARSKLIEIAAFLDRIERARVAHPSYHTQSDYRLDSFKKALAAIAGEVPEKAKAVQMIFSDPTEAPHESAAGLKGATGAWGGKPRG